MARHGIKPINIALQGGGSHGAFSWGVLDALLEDGRLEFTAISGTSAGAMNAVALADGWSRGGRDGARERLEAFWWEVGSVGRFSPVQRTPWDVLWGNWSIENTQLSGFHIGGADEKFRPAGRTHPLEIDLALHHIAQRVGVERIGDIRRNDPRQRVEP